MAARLFSLLALCCRFFAFSHAQSISTSVTVPPLQWINLSNLLQGSTKPPSLKDATIGYDETSRSLIVFGGESEGGFPQSQTYLLNLDTLTWSVPRPPDSLTSTPSARSGAIGGCDFAASNRHGFVIIGGKGSDGKALSDIWEYDFNNQFWAQVSVSDGGPSARWGAVGGIDITTAPVQDSVLPGPNNTFYLIGGTDGSETFTLSDVWRLHMAGTLSSNLPNDVVASWDRVSIGDLPSRTGGAGAVLGQHIMDVGGCSSPDSDDSCPQRDSYILDTSAKSQLSPKGCPVPRANPVLVANTNSHSTDYGSQLFLLLGTFNNSLWDDGGNLDKGEVAILDANAGVWSRVLPSGDPGSTGTPIFPGPRKGAAAFSYTSALVGTSRSTATDTIIFGGETASGQYLSDVWILRAYNGSVDASNGQWSGFGTGELESGVDADGTHVAVDILSECASALTPSATDSTSSSFTSSTSTSGSVGPTSPGPLNAPSALYDTSFYHKLFAPLSLALLLPALVLWRLFSPSYTGIPTSQTAMAWIYLASLLGMVAYGMGIAALALSFVTMRTLSTLTRRAVSGGTLRTTHGRIALAFFIGLYGLVPLGYLILACSRRDPSPRSSSTSVEAEKGAEASTGIEKSTSPDATSSREPIVSEYPSPSQDTTPRRRTSSFGTSALLRPSGEGRPSSDSESLASTGPSRGFEVLNRPARVRKHSGSWLSHAPVDSPHQAQRSLAEIDWLHRRRSLNAVDELDYAITQVIRAQHAPANHDTNAQIHPRILLPSWTDIVLRFLLHFFLIGLYVISLIALWYRAPRATFAVFLVWMIIMYLIIIALSFTGRPPLSVLTFFFARLRSDTSPPQAATSLEAHDTPQPNRPYIHRQAHCAVPPDRVDALSHGHGVEDDDDDEDDDTRQQRMEREMERREVSIVTVPRHKLWITNA